MVEEARRAESRLNSPSERKRLSFSLKCVRIGKRLYLTFVFDEAVKTKGLEERLKRELRLPEDLRLYMHLQHFLARFASPDSTGPIDLKLVPLVYQESDSMVLSFLSKRCRKVDASTYEYIGEWVYDRACKEFSEGMETVPKGENWRIEMLYDSK